MAEQIAFVKGRIDRGRKLSERAKGGNRLEAAAAWDLYADRYQAILESLRRLKP